MARTGAGLEWVTLENGNIYSKPQKYSLWEGESRRILCLKKKIKASTSNGSWCGWQDGSGACELACCQPCGLSSISGPHMAGGESVTPEDCPLTLGEVLHGIHAPHSMTLNKEM